VGSDTLDETTPLILLRLESRFTDEMFHALVCYVCNMFPGLQSLCEKLDGIVRLLAWNGVAAEAELTHVVVELEAYMEARNRVVPPPNFARVELSDTVNPL
jgi:hypothetical protein